MDKIAIANRSLRWLGAQVIESLDETSEAASLVSDLWDGARQSVLRSFPWAFALKTAELANITVADDYDWNYSFTLPADYLYLTKIVTPVGTDIEYARREQQLCINSSELTIEYVADIVDTSKWDSSFTQAFAYELAMEMAVSLTGSQAMQQAMMNGFIMAMGQARQLSGSESRLPDSIGHGFLNARK